MAKRKPTILDVARAVNVSTATVSRVVNGDPRVAEDTRARVSAAMASLGYRHNAIARSLVTGRSGVLGVVVPDIAGVLYSQMARGIEDVLEPHDMHIALVTFDRDADKEADVISLLLSRKVDGLVLIGSQLPKARLKEQLDDDTPVVLMQREATDEAEEYTVLALDNVGGTEHALDRLYRAGHRHIAHVTGVRFDGQQRLNAYLTVMANYDLPTFVVESDSTERGGLASLASLDAYPEVTAVYCSNDRIALGLYRALALRGRRVPDHLSIVGFDDLPWCAYLDPPLTTVRQDGRAMGRAAAMDVLAQVAGTREPHPTTLAAELVDRASVGAPRALAQRGCGAERR